MINKTAYQALWVISEAKRLNVLDQALREDNINFLIQRLHDEAIRHREEADKLFKVVAVFEALDDSDIEYIKKQRLEERR